LASRTLALEEEQSMDRKRILITGAAGFLGSHLCDRFIEEGFEVLAMDNLITGDLRNIDHLFELPQFRFFEHDVSDYVHVSGKLDYILHFASPASPIDYLKIPIQTLKVGSLGTHHLLGTGKGQKGYHSGCLNLGGVWRPARASTNGRLLGQREPCRAARGL
jgi:dTDP-glucose 4,6-dehydratase